MQRFPLQRHRTRVPAIPPSTKPLSQTWSFKSNPWDMEGEPKEWLQFLQANGLSRHLKLSALERNPSAFRETFKLKSERFEWHSCLDPQKRGTWYNLTVHRSAPRLSSKLVATFPWKLRRRIQSSAKPQ